MGRVNGIKGGRKLRRGPHKKYKYDRYRAQKRRERNKIRKIKKYLRKHPNDLQTKKRLEELQILL